MSTNKEPQLINLSVDDLKRLREDFRKWYGCISVDELIQNNLLIEEIQELEKLFSLAQEAV